MTPYGQAEHWAERHAALAAWVIEHAGERPVQGDQADKPTVSLARWVSTQRVSAFAGQMSDEHWDAMDAAFPGWDLQAWSVRLRSFIAYRSAVSGEVEPDDGSAEGRSQLAWLNRQRRASDLGELPEGDRADLDLLAPGWRVVGRVEADRWTRSLDALRQWSSENPGRLPSHWPMGDSGEITMGWWLNRQRAEFRNATLDADRVQRLDTVLPGWRRTIKSEEHWDGKLVEVAGWSGEHGDFPRHATIDREELAMAVWTSGSWRGKNAGRLESPSRRAKLEAVPGFSAPAKRTRPIGTGNLRAVLDHAGAAAAHHTNHGRAPSATSPDLAERVLGKWLLNERMFERNGATRCTPERLAALDQAYPQWRGESPDTRWKATARALGLFAEGCGRMPRTAGSSSTSEAALARWARKRLRELQTGDPVMTPARIAMLDHLAPGWRGSRAAPAAA